MSAAVQEYRDLLSKFLIGNLTVNEFQTLYSEKFKSEARQLEQSEFSVLNELLGDLDAYTDDPELLRQSPNSCLDENTLRAKVISAVTQLGMLDL